MRTRFLLALLLATTTPPLLAAQTLSQMQSGVTLRVTTTAGQTAEGALTAQTGDSLWLVQRNGFRSTTTAVAIPSIYAVQRRDPDRGASALLSALTVGAGAAAVAYFTGGSAGTSSSECSINDYRSICSDTSTPGTRGNVALAAALGAGGGFVLGLLAPTIANWTPVPKD